MERDDSINAADGVAADGVIQTRSDIGDHEWQRVARTPAFKRLVQRKKAFLVPAVVFFMVFYMSLPVLAGFTTVLDGRALGGMTWAYVFAFVQFPMIWIVSGLYRSRANRWDELVEKARSEASEGTSA